MDPRIEALKSTTFSGRRLTRKQIADIRETVQLFPNDSRNELCKTICEHLHWVSARGSYKVNACLTMLEQLERHGILELPAKRQQPKASAAAPVWSRASDPQPEIAAPLAVIGPVRLHLATAPAEVQLWNALADRYHYLGHRRPFGGHLRYFILDRRDRRLGCLLFEASTKQLPCRDRWIGWDAASRDRTRSLLVSNSRFLILPWVRVPHLASKALAMATRRLAADWRHRYRQAPVLVETFVDADRFRAVSYRAANWQRIGQTAGAKGKSRKDVYVYPLHPEARAILRREQPAKVRPMPPAPPAAARDDRFMALWRNIIDVAVATAHQHDRVWQQRRRVLNSLLIVLFVFRLVHAGGRQSYRATLCELWEQCRALEIPLPQPQPPAASSICEAREKLDPALFKTLHRNILAAAAGRPEPSWKGRRIFAVAGSKITLPRPLADAGYPRPNAMAHYPQGLVSALCRLQTRIPVDFDLFASGNERTAALTHLAQLNAGDLVVYDRGYYAFALLDAHRERKLEVVFRIARNANPVFDAFIASDDTDRLVRINAPRDAHHQRGRSHQLRLVKYTVQDTQYSLATTLLDARRHPIPALADLYHGRWGIEELYKSTKMLIESFHSQSDTGVRQELYAAFTLIALARLFANRGEQDLNHNASGAPPLRGNVKNTLRTVGRQIEALFLRQAEFVSQTVAEIMTGITCCVQRERPHRSYDRVSKQPRSKWQSCKPT